MRFIASLLLGLLAGMFSGGTYFFWVVYGIPMTTAYLTGGSVILAAYYAPVVLTTWVLLALASIPALVLANVVGWLVFSVLYVYGFND